jgi:Fis family transcriptional regulator
VTITARWTTGMATKKKKGGSVVDSTSEKHSYSSKRSRRGASAAVLVGARQKPLSALTDEALRGYFASLNGHKPAGLYELVIGQVERPLFSAVLSYTRGNQSEAAEILGINRGTLRKKLKAYRLLES